MSDKEKVSQWMISHSYATGHGTSVADLLQELEWQAAEREREACARLASEPQCWPLPKFTHAPSERTMGRIEGEKEMSRQIAAAIRSRGIDGAKVGEVGVWGNK